MPQTRLQIEHQCPQCGAPITLEETDHLVECAFCRVKSYLVPEELFRYVLPHKAQGNRELIYVPYWHFKGMLFSCVEDEIRPRIVDTSLLGLESSHFPASLGLRSQTLKLRFVTPEAEGLFLSPSLSNQKFQEIIEHRFSESLPRPIYSQSFIGESLSQIFSPFYIDSKIYDAVLNRPVSDPPEDFDPRVFDKGRPKADIRFLPALCPNCGWDLDGSRDSLVLTCRNCKSAWQAGKKGYTRLRLAHLPEEGENILYLPFYRIKADVKGMPLASYADMVKLGNLPKVIQPGWKEIPFRFWFPAFKVRPRDLLRFSKYLTLSQPRNAFAPTLPGGPMHPVTLPVKEAVEGLKTTLAGFLRPPRIMFPKLSDIHITPKSYALIYLPFHLKGNELSQPAFNLRINRNLLTFARNL